MAYLDTMIPYSLAIIYRQPIIIPLWSTVFASLSYTRAIWMIRENNQKYTKQILICGVVVNFVLNSIGIPTIIAIQQNSHAPLDKRAII